ncbi:MAG: DNA-directed DNA polymerase [Nanoarchaeota archaeon]
MDLVFFPIDYDYFELNNISYGRVIGRSENGKRVCLVDEFNPYFWAILREGISDKKIKELSGEIAKLRIKEEGVFVVKIEIHNKKYLDKDVKAIKIFVNSQKAVSKISEKIDSKDISCIRENDLNFISKFIIEKKLIPGNWHRVKGELIASGEFGGINELDVDLCLKVDGFELIENPDKLLEEFIPKVLAFDIETDEFEIGKGNILMISLVSKGFKKVLTWKKLSKNIENVEYFKNESLMLEGFSEYVTKAKPDILAGYFSDRFDLPYIKARAEKNKVKLKLGLDGSGIKFSGGMSPRGKIYGIPHIDVFNFIESAYSQYLQSETLGLGDVSFELLGEKKKEYEFKPDHKMSNDDWIKFFDYNLNDSILTYNLFGKIWHDLKEFSAIMQEPLFNVSRDGMSANVENYIMHNISKYNEIIEEKPGHHEISKRRSRDKYEGAFILQPKPNLYNNIVMFDFTSYWPSIISTFNLSRSTYLGNKKPKIKDFLEVDVGSGNGEYYFSKKKGFFPEMLEDVIKKRKKYKEEYKKNPTPLLRARSNAFKLLANASYGYQGFFGARYYCPEASASTTAISRKFLKEVIANADKSAFKPIYSDTDSIALELGKKTKTQALDFLKKINNDLPGIMELELEDFYKRGIWVTTRKGEFGAKKKYALINEEGKMKIRGFETVRRDWCNLARNLQNNVLYLILKEGNEKEAVKFTREIIKKVKSRNIERKEIMIKTQLKKPISEYKAITPHVTIAKKMIELGIPVNQGMVIQYYIAESSEKKALTRDRAAFPEDTKEYDIEYYLSKQVLPAVENIFQVFGIETDDLIESKGQKKLF